MHVDCQVDDLDAEGLDDLCEDLVMKRVDLCEDKAWHFFEGSLLVLGLLNDVQLTLDSIKDALGKSLDEDLDHSRPVDVQRDGHQIIDDLVHDLLKASRLGQLHDSLAKIVSKLVDHHVRSNWEHEMDQAVQECSPGWRLGHALVVTVLDHLLEHSAASLVETVEVKSVQDLLLFLSEHGHLLLDLLGDHFACADVGDLSFTVVLS